jgi:hypothetical protein
MWRTLLFVFLAVAIAGTGECWTSKTYQLIVVKSVELMPGSFKRVMLRHKEEILEGCLQPDPGPETGHTYDLKTRTGFLQDRILELSALIPQKVNKHVPFKEVARDFGSLSHYMADLNDPLIIGDSDPREPQYRSDFAVYLEKHIDEFPWIFDGHEDPTLQAGNEKEYIYSIASWAVEKYDRIGEAYFPEGTLVSSDTFDWKSLPFGIASLSYSRSITRTVQMWFYVWRKAHGDVTYTPFFSKQKTRSHP